MIFQYFTRRIMLPYARENASPVNRQAAKQCQ